jgi:uncharacterized membrane protein
MNLPITNDAVVLGILLIILAFVFHTASGKNAFWKKFYSIIPSLLLCYFIPGLLNSIGLISGDNSNLYFVASRYLLPTSLVLLTLSVDIKSILKLGRTAIIMTLTATAGIILGGPLAILIVSIFSPETVGGAGPDAVWRGLATVAGDWIGGGANQTAMKEVFEVSDKLFSAMITVSIVVGYLWMGVLLFGVSLKEKIDRWLKADTSILEEVTKNISEMDINKEKTPTTTHYFKILAFGFGVTAIAHLIADLVAPFLKENYQYLDRFSLTSNFFWIVVIATTGGLLLSFTKARELESFGASKLGIVFLFVLVAAIGMNMDIKAIFENPGLFIVAALWLAIHITLLLVVGKVIKSPYFFIAVGSMSNIGGAVSAPIVASAFNPALASVGVLLAVLGYTLGTYGAWVCAIIMSSVAP